MDTSFEFEGPIKEPPAPVKKRRAGRWDAFIAAATAALDKVPFGTWLPCKMTDQKAAESAERATRAFDPAPGVLFETRIYAHGVADLNEDSIWKLALRYVNGERKRRPRKPKSEAPA